VIAILLSTMILATDPARSAAVTETPRTAAPRPAKISNKPVMTCWLEKPVGSHLTKTVCATLDELDKAKRDADDALGARNVGRQSLGGSK
jgi:hypothetical protein